MNKPLLLLGACLLAFSATGASAQTWPARPVRIVVAYPPGGVSDIVSRALADKLGHQLGATVVVENKAGAGGTLGMDAVAKAAPDGYTIGFSSISPLSLNPLLGKVNYDPFKDIVPVVSVMASPVVLLGTPAFTGTRLADVVEQARNRPGALRWGTSGMATVGHIMLEQFKRGAGVDITHIPYKGGGQQQNDALGGQFELLSTNLGPVLNGHIKAGKLKPLAIGAPARIDLLPDVPTFAEAGYPKANMMSVFGIFAPAGTPEPVLQRLNAEINQALAQPDLKARLVGSDNVPTGGSAADFAKVIRTEYDNNRDIIKQAGIKLD
ncbi:Tripartite tricarboxylate transporter family receptor [Pigmentiphaga humi]|uniref:Tripartite tricarboxylate transporter family receptor n=1 Tax=Pigmentiphaga humi TaxID=2478468 RepID=A0A3P4B3F4_9BURK|nr:tripartite tricarboxylate transporter substrate binding protein [Pigmentiphaga humi]VCU70220.1 Tripartite tricarboxylate transporter family receptor [Pigmentiphaga humi]